MFAYGLGHLAANCPRPRPRCSRCNVNLKNHSSPLKGQQTTSGNTKDNLNNTSSQGTSHGTNQTTNMFIDSKNSILLQTARANVKKPGSDQPGANLRIIFDSCSQRSYITKELQRTLHLPVAGQDTLLIKTFGEVSTMRATTM